jgi:hypothetical protein
MVDEYGAVAMSRAKSLLQDYFVHSEFPRFRGKKPENNSSSFSTGVTERCLQTLGRSYIYQKKNEYPYQHVSRNI